MWLWTGVGGGLLLTWLCSFSNAEVAQYVLYVPDSFTAIRGCCVCLQHEDHLDQHFTVTA
jgi:hypothetical protein